MNGFWLLVSLFLLVSLGAYGYHLITHRQRVRHMSQVERRDPWDQRMNLSFGQNGIDFNTSFFRLGETTPVTPYHDQRSFPPLWGIALFSFIIVLGLVTGYGLYAMWDYLN